MNQLQKPRGTQDIFGTKIAYWHFIEQQIRVWTAAYNYHEIRTPMFESYDLFVRGVGETSDIVSKEMYDFYDKGKRHLALKPESTATVVRAYIENKLYIEGDYQKFYYIAPHFRYERSQAGRYRQHHQFGVEVFGEASPYIDAEVIVFAFGFLQQLGLTDIIVKLNSLGDAASRQQHKRALQAHFKPYLTELCEDCQVRFDKNPLRILDCKKDAEHPAMGSAPKLKDYLSPEALAYMTQVRAILTDFNIEYVEDDHLVRGLDYYTHTVFEIVQKAPTFAKAGSLCGGGRYDGLVAQNGGPDKSGIGFGMGIERLVLALESQEITLIEKQPQRVFVAHLDEMAMPYAMQIIHTLRSQGVKVETHYQPKSMKNIFKLSDRFQATDLLIIGEDEVTQQLVTHKRLDTKMQQQIAYTDLLSIVRTNEDL